MKMIGIIKTLYYDPAGYGLLKTTFADAKEIDPTIKKDVKPCFNKKVEQKKQTRGTKSFVANVGEYAYQLDLISSHILKTSIMKQECYVLTYV